MASSAQHYDQHLGPVYRWMVGDLDAARASSEAEFAALGIVPGATRLALDLGAGLGLHATALARLGFEVVAVEASAPMAAELRRETAGLPVRVQEGDLLHFQDHVSGPADVIVCMGDTLPHLASPDAVVQVLTAAAASLASPGVFVATFRDYSEPALTGTSRFILVHGDDDRILTCGLDYARDTVTVHDLLHERGAHGWQLRVSSYPKLRLSPTWVVRHLEAAGLAVEQGVGSHGMVQVVARRV